MSTPTLKRADKLLVELGLVQSRVLAQKLIEQGKASYATSTGRRLIPKASFKLTQNDGLEVEGSDLTKYVSRGGLKLEGALEKAQINPENSIALDVGQSTGGFSDCLLQHGAKKVIGVEVGHDQLNPKLKNLDSIVCLEGINAREMPKDKLLEYSPNGYDIIVMDVSFISQTLILPELVALLAPKGRIVSLVKPQFEVGKDGLGKGGIVRDSKQYDVAEMRIRACCQEVGLKIEQYFDSPIKGGDGNKEFFIVASLA